eukprot:2686136-Pyramimonas_sp.AAC.1
MGLRHEQRMNASRHWSSTFEEFSRTKYRWRKVRGRSAATLAVLLDLKVVPTSPVSWRFPDGTNLKLTDDVCPHALWQALQKVFGELSWSGDQV